jgi:hypothetical protein
MQLVFLQMVYIIDYTSATKFPAGTFSNTYSFTEVFTFNATTDGSGGIDYNDVQIVMGGVGIIELQANGTFSTIATNTYWAYGSDIPAPNAPDSYPRHYIHQTSQSDHLTISH